ncbi:MAG: lipocalin-like domain-containing protein [Mesorhizobium sp.]|uniref:lipocalin-like domain-containing protein n=1 Tax=Mesorhizobium sp. TaxID=1871066 RepID=UPI0012102DFC|nr:lipocalin-like domain-containing protein [Mesorhizobium sp.]TIM39807.1 MAG: lipocalin-like domain-containing protein [Mesorhizobium sp.]
MTKLKFAMFALALAGSAPALAQEAPIIGAWRMTSLQITNSEGKKADVPYSGQVIFSQSGTLSVQAMDPDPAAKPTTYTANGYETYYGPVAIDEGKSTFTNTVESSLVRNLIGQELVRVFEVAGDRLVITPVDPEEGWRVTYERL